MKCPNCNNEIPDGIKFCGKCGKAVTMAGANKVNEKADTSEETDSPEKKDKINKLMIIIPIVVLALVLVIVGTIMGGKLIKDKKMLELYKTVEDKINNEDYDGALATYEEILGTNDKDSQVYMKMADAYMAQDKLDKCKEILDKGYQATNDEQLVAKKKEIEAKKGNVKVGDIITLGSYEQDGSSSNGKEAIEWQVLAVENGKALLISKYGLEQKPYNTKSTSMTWENCSLRKWLNNDFYDNAFTSSEKNKIVKSYVTADKNSKYNTNPGNSTYDNVFLLSINEVKKYFGSDSSRKCKSTTHAENDGVLKDSNGCCLWWLRSPGYNDDIAAYVNIYGAVVFYGNYVGIGLNAVRPALWINL